MGCSLLPSDIKPIDGVMTVVDSTRLCTEQCQKLPALMAASPLASLGGLESQCAAEISMWHVLIDNLVAFDQAWAACADEDIDELRRTTVPVTPTTDWNVTGNISDIHVALQQQADLPVSCPSTSDGE